MAGPRTETSTGTVAEGAPSTATAPSHAPPEEPRGRRRGKVDWGEYGRGPIMLLAAVGLIDAIDKGILPGVLTRVQDDLGFSDFQLGMLEFAFVIATFLVIVPAGYLADKGNRTRIISYVLGSWAVISALTAAVRSFGQFFAVRAALGVGETIDDPASQSLIADYYPPRIRGRAYSYQRVTPTLGRALGTILGAVVASFLGWRAAFLLVGVPGSILAIFVWRMKEPKRGEADLVEMDGFVRDDAAESEVEDEVDPDRIGFTEIFRDIPQIFAIPSLRALLVGFAVASGALSGIGFWAVAFNERHSDLSGTAAASMTGGMILIGAIIGTLIGGRVADRVRDSSPGAPMAAAGIGYLLGGSFLLIGFFDVPVWTVRLPAHTIGVAFTVGAIPATYAMISEVVRPEIRGQAFAASRFLSALIGAFSPPLIGLVADRFPIGLDGGEVGNLALAFALFIPVQFIGGLYLYRGRVHVESDRDVARAATAAKYEEEMARRRERGGATSAFAAGRGVVVDVGGVMLTDDEDAATDAVDDDVDDDDPTGGAASPTTAAADEVPGTRDDEDDTRVVPIVTDGVRGGIDRLREGLADRPRLGDRLSGLRRTREPGSSDAAAIGRILFRVGVGLLVAGVVVVWLGWLGASGQPQVFDQLPYAVSGGLLGVALLGLGGTLVIVARLLALSERRRGDLDRTSEAVRRLRGTLLGEQDDEDRDTP